MSGNALVRILIGASGLAVGAILVLGLHAAAVADVQRVEAATTARSFAMRGTPAVPGVVPPLANRDATPPRAN